MLEAFIIDRIRKERETPERAPLYAPLPQPPPTVLETAERDEDSDNEHGCVVVDFTIE